MTLEAWLARNGLTIPQFAERTGIKLRAMYRYVAHERIPHPDVMPVIVKATKGKVTAQAWYDARVSRKRAA